MALRFSSNGSQSRLVLGPQLLSLRNLFRRLALDLVHVHAPLDPVLGLAAVLGSPVARVGTFHASFRPNPLWNLLFGPLRPITGRAFARLDARIAVSEEARQSVAHYFPGAYTLVPNGVDVERFKPSIAALPGLDHDHQPTILFVGRDDPRKGLTILLAAFARVQRSVPGVRLLVVATPTTARVESLVKTLDPRTRESVLLNGYVPPEQLPRYYATCDVFCSPATGQESQGVVLLEAMASGRPVVAFDIPGYREVVASGEHGWLVPHGDSQALADALVEAVSDRARAHRMGEATRQTVVERYAWPRVAEQLENVFESALRTHSVPRQARV
jgi:phosphatidylinositol alpha-mannosyltransferase